VTEAETEWQQANNSENERQQKKFEILRLDFFALDDH
jgi:hypothetical protein